MYHGKAATSGPSTGAAEMSISANGLRTNHSGAGATCIGRLEPRTRATSQLASQRAGKYTTANGEVREGSWRDGDFVQADIRYGRRRCPQRLIGGASVAFVALRMCAACALRGTREVRASCCRGGLAGGGCCGTTSAVVAGATGDRVAPRFGGHEVSRDANARLTRHPSS